MVFVIHCFLAIFLSIFFPLCFALSLSHVRLFVAPRTIARQAALSMVSCRQNTGVGCHSPGYLPNPGTELGSPHCRQILYHLCYQGSSFFSTKSSQQIFIIIDWDSYFFLKILMSLNINIWLTVPLLISVGILRVNSHITLGRNRSNRIFCIFEGMYYGLYIFWFGYMY